MKSFPEDVYCISLHPSGLSVLVGFSDKLKLMNIVMKDLVKVTEFEIRSCREVSIVCATQRDSPLQVSLQ
jgi:hypothetical protein